jgi:fructoselysine-6-P-deglycase FrlB-like protein
MKLLECCARDAVVSDPEEWCHGPFFVAGSGSLLTCLIASQDDASFFAPAVAAAARIGAGAIGVVDSAESAARAGLSPDRVVVVEGGGPLTPLLCAVPLQVLAMERARRLGTVPFGFSDAQRRSANHGAIYGRE